jgi:hypothetical protein
MSVRIILPSSGSSPPSGPPFLNDHVLTADTTITAGTALTVNRYVEIAAGVTLRIEADADLEIS